MQLVAIRPGATAARVSKFYHCSSPWHYRLRLNDSTNERDCGFANQSSPCVRYSAPALFTSGSRPRYLVHVFRFRPANADVGRAEAGELLEEGLVEREVKPISRSLTQPASSMNCSPGPVNPPPVPTMLNQFSQSSGVLKTDYAHTRAGDIRIRLGVAVRHRRCRCRCGDRCPCACRTRRARRAFRCTDVAALPHIEQARERHLVEHVNDVVYDIVYFGCGSPMTRTVGIGDRQAIGAEEQRVLLVATGVAAQSASMSWSPVPTSRNFDLRAAAAVDESGADDDARRVADHVGALSFVGAEALEEVEDLRAAEVVTLPLLRPNWTPSSQARFWVVNGRALSVISTPLLDQRAGVSERAGESGARRR